MSRDTQSILREDLHFATQDELAAGWNQRDPTRQPAAEMAALRGPRKLSPTDGVVLVFSGALALTVIGTLFANFAVSTPFLSNPVVLALGFVGLGFAFHAVVGSLWVAATSSRRPQIGLALGALAMIAGTSMPVFEATMRSPLRGYYHDQTSCERNLALVQLLVERYERDSEQPLQHGTPEALRPVWERYRRTHAHAFFCPESPRTRELQAKGIDLADASFKDISYVGVRFDADLRQHADLDIGPPLLWEKETNHPDGLRAYTANLGPRTISASDLQSEIEAYAVLQARRALEGR